MTLIPWLTTGCLAASLVLPGRAAEPATVPYYDVVVVGGTPGGIMASLAAARDGRKVLLLERTRHIGGLPANGLGATDIATRGATGGLFAEFVARVRAHYARAHGEGSPQTRDCSDGYHFEPSVAEQVFEEMLAGQPGITVRRQRQFDALPGNVKLENRRLREARVLNRETQEHEHYAGGVFIDATYEGDLAAAAGVAYRLGREAATEFNEPMAGQLYKPWGAPPGPGSTGLGDNAVQAYNYRLCLTRDPARRVAIPQPDTYRREAYISLLDDIRLNRVAAPPDIPRREMAWNGIGRVVNMVQLPNGKTDANNQHASFLSTDLPEENWPWPTATWAWRDRFAARLRDYTLGLLWFVQNDPELPPDFRARCGEWGLARDEYADNAHFPRQVYVREGRRIEGEYLFTARDALPVKPGARPPLHRDSITASHYPLDSHAVRKREPGRVHLDGFFSHPSAPYTVPYGVILPRGVDGLLTPVPVSGTHIGFSTLRMEPCWMALGQAAGMAASLSLREGVPPRRLEVTKLQEALLRQGAVLVYFKDIGPQHPGWPALQRLALLGHFPDWKAEPGGWVSADRAKQLARALNRPAPQVEPGKTTLGELLAALSGAAQR